MVSRIPPCCSLRQGAASLVWLTLFAARVLAAEDLAPDDPLIVDPSRFGVESPERVAVELDGVDVSRWARRDGERLVLETPTRLRPGGHRLDLYEATADGWVRRGGFDFEVRQTSSLRELRGSIRAEPTLSYRVRDNGFELIPDVDRVEARGPVQLRGRVAGESASVDLRAPFFYDSEGKNGGLGKTWDLGSYLLEAKAGPVAARLGHHAPKPSSLILEGFNRRGISVDFDSPIGVDVSGFIYRTDPITGFRESFGISDEDRRLIGASATTDPIDFRVGEIDFGATFYRATGDEGGTGVGAVNADRTTERGTAYDFSVNLSLLDDRIEMQGEWARSNFDFDGGGGGDFEEDTAWSGLAIVRPFLDADLLGQPVDLQLLYEESETGSLFRALGNPGLPNDLWMRTVNLVFYWAGLDVQALHVRSRDNRDDDRARTINREDTWAIDLAYTPHWLQQPREDWLRWLGTPTARWGWSRDRRKPLANEPGDRALDLGVLMLPPEISALERNLILGDTTINETSRNAYVGFGSRWRRWDFEVSRSELRFDDATGLSADSRSKSTSLAVNLRPHQRLTLGGRVQRDSDRRREPDFKTTSHLAGIDLRGILVPGRLDGTVRVDWQKTVTSDRSVDSRSTIYTAYWNWHVVKPRELRPGLSLSLQGTYRDVIDAARRGGDRDAYQVYLRAIMRWSGNFPGGGR